MSDLDFYNILTDEISFVYKMLESNRLVNFIGDKPETSFCLGGEVKAVNGTDPLTVTYDIKTTLGEVKGMIASDLYLYSVGESVMILKKWDGVVGSFFWKEIPNYKNWLLVPVEFRKV